MVLKHHFIKRRKDDQQDTWVFDWQQHESKPSRKACVGCGYSILELNDEQACPECGIKAGVSRSDLPLRLDDSNLRHLLRLVLTGWWIYALLILALPAVLFGVWTSVEMTMARQNVFGVFVAMGLLIQLVWWGIDLGLYRLLGGGKAFGLGGWWLRHGQWWTRSVWMGLIEALGFALMMLLLAVVAFDSLGQWMQQLGWVSWLMDQMAFSMPLLVYLAGRILRQRNTLFLIEDILSKQGIENRVGVITWVMGISLVGILSVVVLMWIAWSSSVRHGLLFVGAGFVFAFWCVTWFGFVEIFRLAYALRKQKSNSSIDHR